MERTERPNGQAVVHDHAAYPQEVCGSCHFLRIRGIFNNNLRVCVALPKQLVAINTPQGTQITGTHPIVQNPEMEFCSLWRPARTKISEPLNDSSA